MSQLRRVLVVGHLAGMLSVTAALARPPGPPRLSPMSTVSQVIGVSEISVTYSRPSARGREIWGELVPWNQVWRTGDNENTTVTFSHDVRIEGEPLAAGTYGLFTIPSEHQWVVIFNRISDRWGAFSYDQRADALRVAVRPRSGPFRETFEISFPEVGADTAVLGLAWGTVEINFTVQVDLRRTALAAARTFVAQAGAEDGQAVWDWANYFFQRDENLGEALTWAEKLAADAPMYWTHALHARLLARLGRRAEAVAAARMALARRVVDADQPGVTADASLLEAELGAWR